MKLSVCSSHRVRLLMHKTDIIKVFFVENFIYKLIANSVFDLFFCD